MFTTYNIYLFTMYQLVIFILLLLDSCVANWIDDIRRAEKNPRLRLSIARIHKKFILLADTLIIISVLIPVLYCINYVCDKIAKKMIGLVTSNA